MVSPVNTAMCKSSCLEYLYCRTQSIKCVCYSQQVVLQRYLNLQSRIVLLLGLEKTVLHRAIPNSFSSTPVFLLCTVSKSETGPSGKVLCQGVLFSSQLLFRGEKQLCLRIHFPLYCLKTLKKCRILGKHMAPTRPSKG